MAWVERAVVSDGIRLTVRDHGGAGTPVLLLHGLAGHSGEWDAVAEALGEYRVIALDQRGHGASERRPADVSRAAYVADVTAVIDALGLHAPVLVGQSLGGHTAMLAAAAHPGRVRALVMIEAGPGGVGPGLPHEIGEWLASWPVPFASRTAAAEFFGGGLAGEGWAAGLERRADGWWPRFEPGLMVESLTELSRRTFWQEWTQVRCPTLVLLAESGFISPEETRQMTRTRPDAVIVTVPGAGHDVHLDEPETVRAAITGFLTAHGSARTNKRDRAADESP
jgi:pimeloyl-ACP methyl ester carboxylesterase